jgi:DNA-binding response OmpR family regulator
VRRREDVIASFTQISADRAPAVSSSPCCLIVEDQVLIALSIEAYLEDAGYSVVGPIINSADALAWLRTHTPQIAILDYSLKDGACTELAAKLSQRQIPFLVYSGHPRRPDTDRAFAAAPWIMKPCTREEILSTVQALMHRASTG